MTHWFSTQKKYVKWRKLWGEYIGIYMIDRVIAWQCPKTWTAICFSRNLTVKSGLIQIKTCRPANFLAGLIVSLNCTFWLEFSANDYMLSFYLSTIPVDYVMIEVNMHPHNFHAHQPFLSQGFTYLDTIWGSLWAWGAKLPNVTEMNCHINGGVLPWAFPVSLHTNKAPIAAPQQDLYDTHRIQS